MLIYEFLGQPSSGFSWDLCLLLVYLVNFGVVIVAFSDILISYNFKN